MIVGDDYQIMAGMSLLFRNTSVCVPDARETLWHALLVLTHSHMLLDPAAHGMGGPQGMRGCQWDRDCGSVRGSPDLVPISISCVFLADPRWWHTSPGGSA